MVQEPSSVVSSLVPLIFLVKHQHISSDNIFWDLFRFKDKHQQVVELSTGTVTGLVLFYRDFVWSS